jgi:hypothetical protein
LKVGAGHIFFDRKRRAPHGLDVELADVKSRALVKWMPDPDWLMVQLQL